MTNNTQSSSDAAQPLQHVSCHRHTLTLPPFIGHNYFCPNLFLIAFFQVINLEQKKKNSYIFPNKPDFHELHISPVKAPVNNLQLNSFVCSLIHENVNVCFSILPLTIKVLAPWCSGSHTAITPHSLPAEGDMPQSRFPVVFYSLC